MNLALDAAEFEFELWVAQDHQQVVGGDRLIVFNVKLFDNAVGWSKNIAPQLRVKFPVDAHGEVGLDQHQSGDQRRYQARNQ